MCPPMPQHAERAPAQSRPALGPALRPAVPRRAIVPGAVPGGQAPPAAQPAGGLAGAAHDGGRAAELAQQPPQVAKEQKRHAHGAVGRGDGDRKSVPLVRDEDRDDVEGFIRSHPSLTQEYIPVAVIGEGTFSTVYKAIDVRHHARDNGAWTHASRQDPADGPRLQALVLGAAAALASGALAPPEGFGALAMAMRNPQTEVSTAMRNPQMEVLAAMRAPQTEVSAAMRNPQTEVSAALRNPQMEVSTAMRAPQTEVAALACPVPEGRPRLSLVFAEVLRFAMREYACAFREDGAADAGRLEAAMRARPPHFVAIKRINATSGPRRIAEELSFLRDLRGAHHVIPVVAALRREDQVLLVSPYFCGVDFRDLLAAAPAPGEVAAYMRLLLEALAHVHACGIVHRDVKPSNFLYARDAPARALLVDFGLAQVADGRRGRPEPPRPPLDAHIARLAALARDLPPGSVENDPRVAMRASRAGTRGFRAPEVLFKVARQTPAIDVWSAGVIMLTLLTRRYPFFHSPDDCDALAELAAVFGDDAMAAAAASYGRTWAAGGLPGVPRGRVPWRTLVAQLCPSGAGAVPATAYDLLDRLLDLDARTRVRAIDALEHPFLRPVCE